MQGLKANSQKRKKKPMGNDKFVRMARKHFANDFPNPERRGCPPAEEVKRLVESPRKGRLWVHNHIAFCSPCYRAYSRFLHARNGSLRSKSARAR